MKTKDYENGFDDGVEEATKRLIIKRNKIKKLLREIEGKDYTDAVDYLVEHMKQI